MADILCPACSKINPEELEICQYCGALLKDRGTEPLATIHPGEMPTPKKTAELERTLPAWLRDIRKGDAGESTEAAETEGIELPAPTPNAPATAKPEPPKKKEESPLDLLAGLSQSNDEEEEIPDWLASLKSNMPGGPVPSPEPAATESQPVDWLASLQDDSQAQQFVSEQPSNGAPAEQPATNWEFDSEPITFNDAEEPAAQTLDNTSDWLASLNAQDANTQAPAHPAAAEAASTEDIPSAGNLPDWLDNLGNQPAQQAAESAPVSSIFEPSTIDDMSSSGDIPPAGDISNWLSSLGNETPAAAIPSEPASTAFAEPASAGDLPPAGDLPDWLASAIGEKTTETPPADSSPSKAFNTGALEELNSLGGTGNLPDWMAGLGTGATLASGAITSEPEQPSAKPVEPALWESSAKEQPAPVTPPTSSDTASGSDTFNWLDGMAEDEANPVETESWPAGAVETPKTAPTSLDVSAPETVTPASVPAFENEQNLDSILSMDMPDWLAGFAPTDSQPAKAGDEQPHVSPFGEDISPANLPSWVQAMRPMEAVISGAESGDEDQSVEKEGPLAGLRSVLPAQASASGPHKSSAYSIKLQVDAAQQAQAALLENLIASEAESQPIVTPKRVVTIRPLRWLIAAVLLLAVLIPALIPTDVLASIFPAPLVESKDQIGLFRQKIDALPDAATVLVVFDYQPGYAGEMEQAAGPVIGDLINKNARLAFVSSSPMGVLMSERMMAQHPYAKENDKEKYVDLGYLPGGAAGIQVFANDPKGTLGKDLKKGDLWASSALQGVANANDDGTIRLSNFAALIILTDNPDTGRMWIEQASQALNKKPMLMVISAQAEPMIRPYANSGQIQGLISGLAGGIAYQQQPNSYWGCYGVGMIAAELLILIGGVWAMIEHFRARRMEQQQEEDEA